MSLVFFFFFLFLIHHVQRHHAPQREKTDHYKKACEKGTFHITQLIQVNVFFFFYRPQLKKTEKKVNRKN